MTSPALPAAPRRPVRRGTEVQTTASGPAPLPTGEAFTLHLLRRATYGITPELLADVARAGSAQRWLD